MHRIVNLHITHTCIHRVIQNCTTIIKEVTGEIIWNRKCK